MDAITAIERDNWDNIKDEDVIRSYINIRDAIKDYEKQCQQQMAPFEDMLGKLAGVMGKRLLERGAQHSATDSGTAFFTTKRQVQTTDREAFLEFCFASPEWGKVLLTKACSKEGLDSFIDSAKSSSYPDGFLPPGVQQSVEQIVQFRKSS